MRSRAEVDELHRKVVRLYEQWAVDGHVEREPGRGVTADNDMLVNGRQAHDIAVEALATRVRRGERLMLVCHCVPRPCHGSVLLKLVMAAAERRDRPPENRGERLIFDAWMRNTYEE